MSKGTGLGPQYARALLLLALLFPAVSNAQTAEEWVRIGDQVHGGFGSLVAYGIRVGLDARQRLGAERRELSVQYADGPQTPCACVLDGIAIAVSASLGQRTLSLDVERTAPGLRTEEGSWLPPHFFTLSGSAPSCSSEALAGRA